ncbi:MAG: hypothetical protein ACJ790_09185 [Myxococcaceae bacterium]
MSQRKAIKGNGFFRALSIVIQQGRQLSVPLQAEPPKAMKRCPHCGKQGRVDRDFGTRLVHGHQRPQSWCRACRTASERTSQEQLQLIAV